MMLAAKPLMSSLRRMVYVAVLVIATGVWLGRSIAATGWSGLDGAVLALIATPLLPRSLAWRMAVAAAFAGSAALAFFVAPRVDASGALALDTLMCIAAALAAARVVADLPAERGQEAA